METLVHADERVDDLQNGYSIIQHPDKFCFGMDAVLLSCFANVKEGEQVLDLGTGTGIIPILLKAKTKGMHFSGLEIQPDSADMARRSVCFNHLEQDIDIVEGDIKSITDYFKPSTMDVVTSNPPYMIGGGGLKNHSDAKTIARHEVLCTLEDVIASTVRVLKPMGRCYYIHRPSRIADILTLMRKYKIEPKRMRLVYPYVNKEPNMVLIEGVRGGGAQLKVEKPLIVYESQNQYTDEIYELYGIKR